MALWLGGRSGVKIAACRDVMARPIMVIEGIDAYAGAARGSVHELVLADVDTYVRYAAAAPGGEKNQVSGFQVFFADRGAGSALRAGGSAERRVGKECVSTCTSRWSPYHSKNN